MGERDGRGLVCAVEGGEAKEGEREAQRAEENPLSIPLIDRLLSLARINSIYPIELSHPSHPSHIYLSINSYPSLNPIYPI